ncbi:MAG: hypothetical protein WD032_01340 [Nitrospirales bacterium]
MVEAMRVRMCMCNLRLIAIGIDQDTMGIINIMPHLNDLTVVMDGKTKFHVVISEERMAEEMLGIVEDTGKESVGVH